MIKPLRKRHFQVWSLLLILLPFILIYGSMTIPEPATDTVLQPVSTRSLPLILSSVSKDNYTANLRANIDTSQLQLQWINKKTLTTPTAVIYQLHNGSNKNQLVGRIEGRGNYHFNVMKDSLAQLTFVLHDYIHNTNIDTIKF